VAAALRPEMGPFIKAGAGAAGRTLSKALTVWAADPSLQAAYARLRTALRDSKRRIVVFIDDLDRLDSEEVRAIAQMVKSVGGLPNVTYVLAYDRAIIRRALDGGYHAGAGTPRYDEKIVQHEVSLPTPTRRKLLRLLDEHTGHLLGPTEANERWYEILRVGVERWIRSVRDVVRLSNALAFAAPALDGELDPQDLLAMEGLRLFDDVAFKWVQSHRSYLLGEDYGRLFREDEAAEAIDRLHASLAPESRTQVIALLCILFPSHAKALAKTDRGYLMGGEPHASVVKRRGIATSDGYSAYFGLSGSAVRVSKREVDEVMAKLDDDGVVGGALKSHLERVDEDGCSLISQFLEELRYRFEGAGVEPTPVLLQQVLMLGDAITMLDDDTEGTAFEVRSLRYLTGFVEVLFKRLEPARAGAMFEAALDRAPPVAALAEVYVDRGRELGVFPTDVHRHDALIDREHFDRIGPRLAQLIAASADGAMLDAPRYWNILRVWRHFGDPQAARDWIRDAVENSASRFAKVALGHLAYSVGSRGNGYFLRSRPTDENFTIEDLHRLAIKHQDDPTLTPPANRRIAALRAGLDALAADPQVDLRG
jgi:hypothetical protein